MGVWKGENDSILWYCFSENNAQKQLHCNSLDAWDSESFAQREGYSNDNFAAVTSTDTSLLLCKSRIRVSLSFSQYSSAKLIQNLQETIRRVVPLYGVEIFPNWHSMQLKLLYQCKKTAVTLRVKGHYLSETQLPSLLSCRCWEWRGYHPPPKSHLGFSLYPSPRWPCAEFLIHIDES